jgi:hypothetical protein
MRLQSNQTCFRQYCILLNGTTVHSKQQDELRMRLLRTTVISRYCSQLGDRLPKKSCLDN